MAIFSHLIARHLSTSHFCKDVSTKANSISWSGLFIVSFPLLILFVVTGYQNLVNHLHPRDWSNLQLRCFQPHNCGQVRIMPLSLTQFGTSFIGKQHLSHQPDAIQFMALLPTYYLSSIQSQWLDSPANFSQHSTSMRLTSSMDPYSVST